MSNEVTRTPEQVAADINSIKFRTSVVLSEASRMAKRSAVAIGKLLEEAKCLVPHGEWGSWLKENVEYSESTANNLMRCYREYGDEQIDMISGVSDAEFYEILNQSQMVELFALPKAERRAFVEEHREELESGDMSIRDMKAEIAKLRMEREKTEEALGKAVKNIEGLERDVQDLSSALEEERRKPEPEPIVQNVIVNQPSEEQMEAMRAEVTEALRETFIQDLESCQESYEATIRELKEKIEEAKKDEKRVEQLEADLKKVTDDHRTAEKKLKEKYEKKLEELEAEYKKKEKANAAGADSAVVRIQLSLEAFAREVRAVASTLKKLEDDGEGGKAGKLRAQVENLIRKLVEEAGLSV